MDATALPLIPLPSDDATLITAERLPAYIGVARQTLARWRCEGQGPAFVKVGHKVAYRTGDVRRWLAARTLANTSAALPPIRNEFMAMRDQ